MSMKDLATAAVVSRLWSHIRWRAIENFENSISSYHQTCRGPVTRQYIFSFKKATTSPKIQNNKNKALLNISQRTFMNLMFNHCPWLFRWCTHGLAFAAAGFIFQFPPGLTQKSPIRWNGNGLVDYSHPFIDRTFIVHVFHYFAACPHSSPPLDLLCVPLHPRFHSVNHLYLILASDILKMMMFSGRDSSGDSWSQSLDHSIAENVCTNI